MGPTDNIKRPSASWDEANSSSSKTGLELMGTTYTFTARDSEHSIYNGCCPYGTGISGHRHFMNKKQRRKRNKIAAKSRRRNHGR
jgi:hypothetical protein